MWLGEVFTAKRAAGKLFGILGGDVRENAIVNGNSGSMIAAPETGNIPNLHIISTRIGESAFEISAQLTGAVETTAHVRADTNLRCSWGDKMKMRIETCDAVKLVERRLGAL
jgi:hypothetical protein